MNSALRLASREGRLSDIKRLITAGADVHDKNEKALRWAFKSNYLYIFAYIVESGNDFDSIRIWDDYFLRISCREGRIDFIKYLLAHGANLHAKDDEALRQASRHGHLEVVKYLVEHGANIHARNNDAFRWASRGNYMKIMKFLVKHGAGIYV